MIVLIISNPVSLALDFANGVWYCLFPGRRDSHAVAMYSGSGGGEEHTGAPRPDPPHRGDDSPGYSHVNVS